MNNENTLNIYINELSEKLNNTSRYSTVKLKSNLAVLNTDTGQVDNNAEFIMKKKVNFDNETFTKYFTKRIKFSKLNLSRVALQLIFYIMENVRVSKNLVKLDYKYLKEYFNLKSHTSIYKAVKELLSIDLIFKTEDKHIFQVNPTYIFNGNRIKFINKLK